MMKTRMMRVLDINPSKLEVELQHRKKEHLDFLPENWVAAAKLPRAPKIQEASMAAVVMLALEAPPTTD
jgi:hypothetical protein